VTQAQQSSPTSDGHPYDVVILGGGSGGYACAFRAAQLGLRVALIEKDKLGGTCLHRGCIPTKALLHAGEVADAARDAAAFGIDAQLNGIDIAGVNSYKDGIVSRLYKGLQGLAKSHKLTLVEGVGRLSSATSVTVGNDTYTGRAVVLATGSVPRSLPGLDIDGQRILTSDQALSMDRVPASVVVLGGGVIGVEFASVWRSFGAEVTIVEALPRLVPAEDAASSKLLERAFRKRGIAFHTGVRFSGCKVSDDGVQVTLENGTQIDAELLLVAVGRGPVSADLGYEQVGVAMDRGYVTVDDHCRTSIEGVYAVGDLIPTLQLAHVGFAEGILVAEQIAGLSPAPIDYAGVPRVTYCDPEVASVGLTSDQARERGHEVEELSYDLAGNGKSQILRTAGAVKLVRAKDGPVLGIHIVGARAGELIGEAQLIYNWEAFPDEVAQLIHAHPTQTEALGEAHLALAGKPLHAHG
jgi:dihydrolipoamide dehydrogenase